MNYQGPLFAKVGRKYVPLVQTSEDFDRLERENIRLRGLLQRSRDMIDVSPEDSPDKWPSTDQINQLVKDCDDIL
jgi:hypothetical protein